MGELKSEEGIKRLAIVGSFDDFNTIRPIQGDYKMIDSIPKVEMRKILLGTAVASKN